MGGDADADDGTVVLLLPGPVRGWLPAVDDDDAPGPVPGSLPAVDEDAEPVQGWLPATDKNIYVGAVGVGSEVDVRPAPDWGCMPAVDDEEDGVAVFHAFVFGFLTGFGDLADVGDGVDDVGIGVVDR